MREGVRIDEKEWGGRMRRGSLDLLHFLFLPKEASISRHMQLYVPVMCLL